MDRSENMDSEKDVDLSRLPLSERSRIERKNSSGKKNVLFFLLGMLVGIVGIFAIGVILLQRILMKSVSIRK